MTESTKYHIGVNDRVLPCKAKPGQCKYGEHFNSIEEGQQYNDLITMESEKIKALELSKWNTMKVEAYLKDYISKDENLNNEFQTFSIVSEREINKWDKDEIKLSYPKFGDDYSNQAGCIKISEEIGKQWGIPTTNKSYHAIVETPDKIVAFPSSNQLLDIVTYDKFTKKLSTIEVKTMKPTSQMTQRDLNYHEDGTISIDNPSEFGELGTRLQTELDKYSSIDNNYSRSNFVLNLSERDKWEYFIKEHSKQNLESLNVYTETNNWPLEFDFNYNKDGTEESLQKDIDNMVNSDIGIKLWIRQNYGSNTRKFNEKRDLDRFKNNYLDSFNTFNENDKDYQKYRQRFEKLMSERDDAKKKSDEINREVFSDEFKLRHGSQWVEEKNKLRRNINDKQTKIEKELMQTRRLMEEAKTKARYVPENFRLKDLDKTKDWVQVSEENGNHRIILGEFILKTKDIKDIDDHEFNIREFSVQQPKLTGELEYKKKKRG